jgi:hypothetical protein
MAGVRESDLVGPTLRLLSEAPDGFMNTSELIAELTAIFNPTGKDAEIAADRNDTYFSQKVRNLVSHRGSNFISEGLATYDQANGGLQVTQKGRDYVKALRAL